MTATMEWTMAAWAQPTRIRCERAGKQGILHSENPHACSLIDRFFLLTCATKRGDGMTWFWVRLDELLCLVPQGYSDYGADDGVAPPVSPPVTGEPLSSAESSCGSQGSSC